MYAMLRRICLVLIFTGEATKIALHVPVVVSTIKIVMLVIKFTSKCHTRISYRV